ncbi:MAG: DUF1570 domain-containing protein [Planctomycetes bacterium]|nr:DUF1570 domain-containing protein [Planctomycetota bacterium]
MLHVLPAAAATPALMELTVDGQPALGRLAALGKERGWLLERDGRLREIDLGRVSSVRRAENEFRPCTVAELRDALRRELGREMEVSGTAQYIVCAPAGRSRHYAQVFDEVYRGFRTFFSVRGFQVPKPEFPLAAIVFPDPAAFAGYCRKDGVPPQRGLMGYYLRTSNRVALFEEPGAASADHRRLRVRIARRDPWPERQFGFFDPQPSTLNPQPFATLNPQPSATLNQSSISAGLRDTMIHEATHQVAFNVGLHSRIGENPTWVVEGLATVFEADGIRDQSLARYPERRVNIERLAWFAQFRQRRPPKSLAAFVSDDRMFQRAALDAYSQAWALTFYLLETRPAAYARYLRHIAERDPLAEYNSDERLADFRAAFGSNIDLLEADFLRHMEGVGRTAAH